MIRTSRRTFPSLLAACALTGVAGPTMAQTFPSKPVELVVSSPPGGTTDIIARVIAPPLTKAFGQPVVVVNKAGSGGLIGAQDIARAAPDGHKLGVATVSITATNPAINPKAGFDPVVDFTAVSNIAVTPNVIAVHPGFPARDYAGFVAELKKNPGKYSYASPGTGGVGHMLMELYKSLTGTRIVHIPYRGAGPALNDVVGGQVPMIFDNLPSALPFIKAGRLVPIVVAAPKRLAELPNVPTFAEVGLAPVNRMAYYGVIGPKGLPDVNRMAYYGILGPKGLPDNVVQTVYNGVKKALENDAVRKRIEETGSLIVGNTPAEFAKQIQDEYKVYQDVVTKQKLSLD